jgi:TRAP-type C4-dicarboxylate transport system substrate-binding protein
MRQAYSVRGLVRTALVMALVMILGAAACGEVPEDPGAAPEDDAPTAPEDGADTGVDEPVDHPALTVRVATIYGPDHWQSVPIQSYADAINARSNGQIEFEIHWAGSLLPVGELITGTGDGVVEMAVGVPAYTPDRFPIDDWLSRLGFLPDPPPDVPHGPLVALAAPLDWSLQSDEYQEEFRAQGVEMVGGRIQPVGARFHLICNDPVTSLADARGKRVRVGGPAWADEVEAVGMVPVTVPGPEIFEAMQRGIADCHLGNVGDILDFGLLDIAKHFTVSNFLSFSSYGLVVNLDWWTGLPTETQSLLREEVPTFLAGLARGLHEQEVRFRGVAEELGVTIHDMAPDFANAVDNYHQDVLSRMAGDAPTGVADPQGTVDFYVSSFDRWNDLVAGLGIPAAETYADWNAQYGAEDFDLEAWQSLLAQELPLRS